MPEARERLLPPCPIGSSWEPVLAGESVAAVFRRSDGAVFAKCVVGGVGALRDERDRTAWLARTDVPCTEVADWYESGDAACLVTTAIDGIPACDVPVQSVLAVLGSLADVVRRLHEIATQGCPFDRRLSVMVPVVEDVVRRGAVHTDYLDVASRATPPGELLAGIRAELGSATQLESTDLVVCQGDACLPNFLIDPERLDGVGVIDLGRLGIADRYADLSLVTATIGSGHMNPQFSEADADNFLMAYGVNPPDRDRLRFYRLLDALSWG